MDIFTKVKAAIISSELFGNWFELLLKYVLYVMGFKTKLSAKIEKCRYPIVPKTFEIIIGMFMRGLAKSLRCYDGKIFVDGIELEDLNDILNPQIRAKIFGWTYNGSYWIKNGIKFKRMYSSILQIFD